MQAIPPIAASLSSAASKAHAFVRGTCCLGRNLAARAGSRHYHTQQHHVCQMNMYATCMPHEHVAGLPEDSMHLSTALPLRLGAPGQHADQAASAVQTSSRQIQSIFELKLSWMKSQAFFACEWQSCSSQPQQHFSRCGGPPTQLHSTRITPSSKRSKCVSSWCCQGEASLACCRSRAQARRSTFSNAYRPCV